MEADILQCHPTSLRKRCRDHCPHKVHRTESETSSREAAFPDSVCGCGPSPLAGDVDEATDVAYTALVEKTDSLRRRFSSRVRTQTVSSGANSTLPHILPAPRPEEPTAVEVSATSSLCVPATQNNKTYRTADSPARDMWECRGEFMDEKRSAVMTELYKLYTLLHVLTQ